MSQLQRLAIAPNQRNQNQVTFTPAQQHYLGRVLRLKIGDRLMIMDGTGQEWLAQLQPSSTATLLEPVTLDTELPLPITLLIALPKNGFDEVVRSCTELGVNSIIPMISDRTLLKPSPQKLERWRRIALEAAEQSERQIIPTILDPVSFKEAIALTPENAYLCCARGKFPHLLEYQTPLKHLQSPIAIATGPEGGWTPEEMETAIAQGFQPISLGRRILKAVTAPLMALSLIAGMLESHQSCVSLENLPNESFTP